MYFIMDAILASILLISGLFVLSQYPVHKSEFTDVTYMSSDLLNGLTSIYIYELNGTNAKNSFVVSEIANGNITDQNNTVLEQVGEYWARNETDKAAQLVSSVINSSGINLNIQLLALNAYRTTSDQLYVSNSTQSFYAFSNVVSSRRMISGIDKGKPLEGSTSTAYIRKIQNKKNSAYFYFGGFVGQGTITLLINNLPSDLSSVNLIDVYLEGDFGGNFSLNMNNHICGNVNGSQIFPANARGNISQWNITNCVSFIQPYSDNFTINFSSSINNDYIGGGFLRIDYVTNQFQSNINYGYSTYNFPGIDGIVNLYDSFYVPGNLTSMSMGLHMKANASTYITIGDRNIVLNVSTASGNDSWVYLDNNFFLNNASFDYSLLSTSTVPIRLASYSTINQTITISNADVVLITDFSGSMKKAVNSWSQGNLGASCGSAFNDSTTRRTNLALCLDTEFVNNIMNVSGNRVWPVFIYNDNIAFYNNPTNAAAITGYINSYANGQGKTCLSCAMNMAYDILNNYSSSNRKKFIVLMTDGVPTNCASGSCLSNLTAYGVQYCEGLCDIGGSCSQSDIPGECGNCTANSGPTINLNSSSQRVAADFGATIYTVGFGPIDDCPLCSSVLSGVARIGNGSYQHSSNATNLRVIYQNISNSILYSVQQINQSVNSPAGITVSKLYSDSYINFTYTPLITNLSQDKIAITVQIPMPNCTSIINIPSQITVTDAKALSYSGDQWSDVLVANGNAVFNLSKFYLPYTMLGDPFNIYIPVNVLTSNTSITLGTVTSSTNRSGCSAYNSFIYSGLVSSTTSRTGVLNTATGCIWTVAFEDGTVNIIKIPKTYLGNISCSYQPGNISYDTSDTYDVTVDSIFKGLDLNNDGKLYININAEDLEVIVTSVNSVPYLWGPSIIEARVWK